VNDLGGLWHLASAVARHDRMAELLPLFHQRAINAASGRSSVLLRLNPRSGLLQADSAAGLETLDPDPWLNASAERGVAERAWAGKKTLIVPAGADLARRLQAPFAAVAPLQARERRLGLLVVGTDDREQAASQLDEIGAIADMLSLALERARFRREDDLQHDLRELSANLTTSVSSTAHLGATLEVFCVRAARLFAADRVSVWLHNRRARLLEIAASSDAAELAEAQRVATDDASAPLSAVMRQPDVTVVPQSDDRAPDVFAPLRGRRRALGTLELRGVRIETGDAVDLLDRVEEVARHLSGAVENVYLLEDLLRSRRELESTFNSLTDLVIVTDGRLRITQANSAFAHRASRSQAELKEQPLSDFVGRAVVTWIEQHTAGDVAPEPIEREIADEKLNGTFVFTVSPLVGSDEEHVGTVIVARDVTAQAQLAAEGAELRSRLTQSEKLAALGQFVAGIAHELNNPLQGVLGHLELLLQDAPAANRLRRDLKLVFREADRAAKIVHNLLVFAGSRRITRRRLNVNHVVNKVLTLRATGMAAASIDVVKDLTPKLPRVAGDALLLQQAILNIVLNAEQAMAQSAGPRRLEVRTRMLAADKVEIAIADSGPGIATHALPRLFEPFFTTKEVGQGTGLGLAITYGIVQEHGGRLDARNRADGGAVFTIALPAGSSDAVE
jgi:signal transduction histidine kinase